MEPKKLKEPVSPYYNISSTMLRGREDSCALHIIQNYLKTVFILSEKYYIRVNNKAQAPPQNFPVCTFRNNQSVPLIGHSFTSCFAST